MSRLRTLSVSLRMLLSVFFLIALLGAWWGVPTRLRPAPTSEFGCTAWEDECISLRVLNHSKLMIPGKQEKQDW